MHTYIYVILFYIRNNLVNYELRNKIGVITWKYTNLWMPLFKNIYIKIEIYIIWVKVH